jgi:gliding motility-associated-like protein
LNITASVNNICPDDAVTFTAVAANTGTTPSYQWKLNDIDVGGNSNIYNNKNFSNGDKIYCIMHTQKSCPATSVVHSDTIMMAVKPVPVISFDPSNPAISFGSSIQLHATVTGNIGSYVWTPSTGLNDPSSLNPVANPPATTAYNLKVIATNTCTVDKTLTVKVFEKIYIPNSFTPNADGVNDIFRIPSGITFNLESFMLYDRYGNTVFKTTDINKGWDGMHKGVLSPQGNYTYLIKGTDAKGTVILKGSILLIR